MPVAYNKRVIVILCILTLVTFLFRLSYNWTTKPPIRADAGQYVMYAYNLNEYGVFSLENSPTPSPDSFRSPGYPLLLAAVLKFTKNPAEFYESTRLIQALMGTLMVPLIFYVAVLLGASVLAAIGAALFTALSPHLVTLSSYFLTETMTGFFFLLAMLALLITIKKHNFLWSFFSGISFGIAYLTNEVLLFLPFILVFFEILRASASRNTNQEKRRRGESIKGVLPLIALVLAVYMLFPSSWYIRNTIADVEKSKTGQVRAMQTLAHGSYPHFVYEDPAYRYFPHLDDPRFKEYSSSFDSFATIFAERFRERPVTYLYWYAIGKPYYLWSWNILQGKGDVYVYPVAKSLFSTNAAADAIRLLMKMLHPLLMALCMLGLVMIVIKTLTGPRSSDRFLWLLMIVLYITAIYTIFAAWPRYSIPFRPIFYLTSLVAIQLLFEHYYKETKPEDHWDIPR